MLWNAKLQSYDTALMCLFFIRLSSITDMIVIWQFEKGDSSLHICMGNTRVSLSPLVNKWLYHEWKDIIYYASV